MMVISCFSKAYCVTVVPFCVAIGLPYLIATEATSRNRAALSQNCLELTQKYQVYLNYEKENNCVGFVHLY